MITLILNVNSYKLYGKVLAAPFFCQLQFFCKTPGGFLGRCLPRSRGCLSFASGCLVTRLRVAVRVWVRVGRFVACNRRLSFALSVGCASVRLIALLLRLALVAVRAGSRLGPLASPLAFCNTHLLLQHCFVRHAPLPRFARFARAACPNSPTTREPDVSSNEPCAWLDCPTGTATRKKGRNPQKGTGPVSEFALLLSGSRVE